MPIGPDDSLLYVDQVFAETVGSEDPEELQRMNPAILSSTPKERPERQELRQQSEFFDGHEVKLRRRDGSTSTGFLTGMVVRDDGSVKYYDGAVADITAQKRAERALRRGQAALRQMYWTTADREVSYQLKSHQLLDPGRDCLGVSAGFVSRISEGSHEIVRALGTHLDLRPGAPCPLPASYCPKTNEQDSLLTVHNAEAERRAGGRSTRSSS